MAASERPYAQQVAEGKRLAVEALQDEARDAHLTLVGIVWLDEDKRADIYTLEFHVADKRYTLDFSEEDLADAPATPEIRGKLRRRANVLLRRVVRDRDMGS